MKKSKSKRIAPKLEWSKKQVKKAPGKSAHKSTKAKSSVLSGPKLSPAVKGWGRAIAVSLATLLLATAACAVLVDRMMQPDAFAFKRIQINGELRYVEAEQVRVAANQALHGNFFSVDLEQVEQSVKRVPWVLHASIRRKWPETLAVEIGEIQPIARWGSNSWLDKSGQIVSLPQDAKIPKLPTLNGPVKSEQQLLATYRRWSSRLSEQGLYIKALELTPRRSWKLTLFENQKVATAGSVSATASDDTPHNVDVLLGRVDMDNRLNRLLLAYRQNLRNNFSQVRQIDLRYPNGFALTPSSTPSENAKKDKAKAQITDQDAHKDIVRKQQTSA